MWWSYFTALRLGVLWWVDHGRDAAGLGYSELKQGSQLLQETLLKLENDQPLLLLVKPKQIPV